MSRSYDAIPDFGLLYDSVPLYADRQDVGFYVEEVARSGGPVLEVGCGTGRILLPLARAGHTVVGLDSSRLMLARCREKVAAEPASVRERITLHEDDARRFELGKGAAFRLVIAPFRVFQHMTTIDDQLACLASVTRHLVPGGRFVFDVFNPHFDKLTGADGVEREDTSEQILPDGRAFRRAARVTRVRWVDQVSEIELVYYVSARPGAPAERFVQSFDMRWYLRAELEHLLVRAGFRVREIYGDFGRGPVADACSELIVSAERTRT